MNNPEPTQNKRIMSESENSDNSQTQEDLEKQTRGKRKRKESRDEEEQDFPGRFSDIEKTELFQALIQHGSGDIPLLHTYVPSKTEEQIRQFVFSHKRVARHTISGGRKKAPIDKWLDFLITDFNDREKLQDMTRVLKYIALFEPNNKNEAESMLSDCYKLLSDCMRGEAPKHLNPVTSMFLNGMMQKLIRMFKSENFDREHKYLETYKKKPPCYLGKRKARNNEKVDETQISNPLKIPDSLLDLKK